ncbi:MAG: SufE family protein, partial [Proteobacteria bacterium]|nr:SufE family protein [Pseudomonadota bacterium]
MISITQKKDRLIQEMAKISDVDERYRFIIAKGKSLPEISSNDRLDKFLIAGCLSKAWLIPKFDGKTLEFSADSEAAIVKGIMALLLDVYSQNSPAEILSLSPDFLKEAGITEHLSMNRRNGLSGVIKQVMLYA